MTKYKSKFTGHQIDDGIEYGVRVTQQTFSSAQKQQARENIGVTPEVQVGGNTPASDSGVKLFVDEDSDDTVEVYTKAQAAGQFVAVVNMNTEPTESTLTYTSTDGTTKNFKVGDEIRVLDVEADNGYTFYKLYALTTESGVTTATWDKLGAGGGATQEFAVISLKTDNNNDSALTGVTIVITDDNTSETILSTTWNGNDIIVSIDGGTEYTVTVGNVTHYEVQNTQSYTALVGFSRYIQFVYNEYFEYVDLGLPSGVKWAKMNIGAETETDYGYYFSFGNTEGHLWGDGYSFSNEAYNVTPGYALSGDIPAGSLAYDAAAVNMGTNWKMPSSTETQELLDNTDREWVSNYNSTGISGMKVMKKTDHSVYIFFPAAGMWNNTGRSAVGSFALLTIRDNCYYLRLGNGDVSPKYLSGRPTGFPIRAIK